MTTEQALQDFLLAHQLPDGYLAHARHWFLPLGARLAALRDKAQRPLLVGINGCQGSGKSTLASLLTLLLTGEHGCRAIDLSIDDFYLTRAARQQLAHDIHPLLATRGVPGTHDVALMGDTLQALLGGAGEVAIPRFDKSRDDRADPAQWPRVEAPLDIVILEGWCLGTRAQSQQALAAPVNELEQREDPRGSWRAYVNSELQARYHPLYDRVDVWIMLQAPSFASVYRWRLEQEQKLAAAQGQAGTRVMSPEQVGRFIQHYQRLTEHALATLPSTVHHLFKLDEHRQVIVSTQPQAVTFA